ncbi:hypothetical protein B7494_g6973 [Chlorociboria aeruginascens]|nr:hypothetical protein B7494_g6973 [Chlorociboria aeruginascens]
MATPTPASKAPASSHVAAATPPVSTPFSNPHTHPAFSPHNPRSVGPSPQQIKKSPANSNTIYGFTSGGTTGGAAAGHATNSSFGGMNGYDSPSAAMALGGVPGLGDLGLDGLGLLGGLGQAGRGDEEEKARRLGAVVEVLKANKGRLSEAGMERLARRVGLECLWEDQMGSGDSGRTLIIAGSALALDIDFSNNIVKKVSLSFPDSPQIVARHTEKAGNILLRDLEFGKNESPLTKMLDRFAANLERLATLDKLSVIPGLNCHEAISGIYESLEKLHLWEVGRLREQDEMRGREEEFMVRTATCTKSGKPVMHTRDRLGLSLDYWQEKRRLPSKSTNGEEPKTWSLLVECAPLPALVYTPLRVSENWISTDIQKANPPAEDLFLTAEDGPVLDWLEPDNTLLPSTESEQPKPDGLDGIDHPQNQKYPEVMFVAKFDPPLIVPYGVAMQIHNSTNAPLDVYQMTSFDGLMFPHHVEDKDELGEARTIIKETLVPVFDAEGKKSFCTHKNSLFIEKIDYGRNLTELPFSHPRQLVEMLPSLRQYALLSTLLRKTFSSTPKPISEKKERINLKKNKRDEFSDFMSEAISTSTDIALAIDVSLTIQPLPRLQLVFPFRERTANVTFEIKLNGKVEVVGQNVLEMQSEGEGGEGKGKGKMWTKEDLGMMLEVCEDLGMWADPKNAKPPSTPAEHRKIQGSKTFTPHMTNTSTTIVNDMPSVAVQKAPPELISSMDPSFMPKDSVADNTERMTGVTQDRNRYTGEEMGVGQMEGVKMRIEPLRRTGEDANTMRARLLYQSRKRGTLESDLLMSTFAEAHLRTMTPDQMAQYDLFLDENDWDIYYWATQEPTPTSLQTAQGSIEKTSPVAEHTDAGKQTSPELVDGKPRSGEWAQTVGTFKPAYRPVPARWRDSEILAMLRRHVTTRSAEGIHEDSAGVHGEGLAQSVRGTGGGGMAFMPPVFQTDRP